MDKLLFAAITAEPAAKAMLKAVKLRETPVLLTGPGHIHRAALAAALSAEQKTPLVLTSDEAEAAKLTEDLTALGVDEETAAADACKIEHVISDQSFEALKEYLSKTMK